MEFSGRPSPAALRNYAAHLVHAWNHRGAENWKRHVEFLSEPGKYLRLHLLADLLTLADRTLESLQAFGFRPGHLGRELQVLKGRLHDYIVKGKDPETGNQQAQVQRALQTCDLGEKKLDFDQGLARTSRSWASRPR